MLTNTNINKKAMILALDNTLGIVSSACQKVGISRITHYEWYNTDEDYRKAVDDVKSKTLDFAESKLLESIKNGSDTATIFYLKTQGKKRGYIERGEIEHSGGIEIKRTTIKWGDKEIKI